jgi:quinol monooxygenase YgiN
MSETPVTVLASFRVKPGLDAYVRQVFQSIIGPTREEPGCLVYDLHQSETNPAEFLIYENWTSEEALATHTSSMAAHRVALRQQLGELLDGPPTVTRWRRIA